MRWHTARRNRLSRERRRTARLRRERARRVLAQADELARAARRLLGHADDWHRRRLDEAWPVTAA